MYKLSTGKSVSLNYFRKEGRNGKKIPEERKVFAVCRLNNVTGIFAFVCLLFFVVHVVLGILYVVAYGNIRTGRYTWEGETFVLSPQLQASQSMKTRAKRTRTSDLGLAKHDIILYKSVLSLNYLILSLGILAS